MREDCSKSRVFKGHWSWRTTICRWRFRSWFHGGGTWLWWSAFRKGYDTRIHKWYAGAFQERKEDTQEIRVPNSDSCPKNCVWWAYYGWDRSWGWCTANGLRRYPWSVKHCSYTSAVLTVGYRAIFRSYGAVQTERLTYGEALLPIQWRLCRSRLLVHGNCLATICL